MKIVKVKLYAPELHTRLNPWYKEKTKVSSLIDYCINPFDLHYADLTLRSITKKNYYSEKGFEYYLL